MRLQAWVPLRLCIVAQAKPDCEHDRLPVMKAIAFDAYGTLFDVFSVTSLCEELFPAHGQEMAQMWRRKQLEYSWLRSLMDRYRDFWSVTEDALTYSAKSLNLDLTPDKRAELMASYL